MKVNYKEILDLIKDSNYVLIGCGTELSRKHKYISQIDSEEDKIYKPLHHLNLYSRKDLDQILNGNNIVNWIDDVLHVNYNKQLKQDDNFYQIIYKLVKDKEYFVVNMNTDLTIYQSELDISKIVSPCGNEGLFQCEKLCTTDIWANDHYVKFIIDNLDIIIEEAKVSNESVLEKYYPKCPNCNSHATLNIRKDASSYNEKGYLDQWQTYLLWLQKTLNRKILIVELGEDFNNPMVIRWPFEKNTFINNQAKMIRINNKFPQIPEEIKDKSISISMNSLDFLNEINKFI